MNLESEEAIRVLEGIISSVQYDVQPILDVRNSQAQNNEPISNVWTLPRVIFPEIDGIARLRYGVVGNSGRQIAMASVRFMKSYFPQGQNYDQLAGFQYVMYRHTLLHSHFPRNVMIAGEERYWMVQAANIGQVAPLGSSSKIISLDGYYLYEGFIEATKKYIRELNDPGMSDELLSNFNRAYDFIRSPVSEEDLRAQVCIDPEDYDYFK